LLEFLQRLERVDVHELLLDLLGEHGAGLRDAPQILAAPLLELLDLRAHRLVPGRELLEQLHQLALRGFESRDQAFETLEDLALHEVVEPNDLVLELGELLAVVRLQGGERLFGVVGALDLRARGHRFVQRQLRAVQLGEAFVHPGQRRHVALVRETVHRQGIDRGRHVGQQLGRARQQIPGHRRTDGEPGMGSPGLGGLGFGLERPGQHAQCEQVDREVSNLAEFENVGRVLGFVVAHDQPHRRRAGALARWVGEWHQAEAGVVVANLDPIEDLAALGDRDLRDVPGVVASPGAAFLGRWLDREAMRRAVGQLVDQLRACQAKVVTRGEAQVDTVRFPNLATFAGQGSELDFRGTVGLLRQRQRGRASRCLTRIVVFVVEQDEGPGTRAARCEAALPLHAGRVGGRGRRCFALRARLFAGPRRSTRHDVAGVGLEVDDLGRRGGGELGRVVVDHQAAGRRRATCREHDRDVRAGGDPQGATGVGHHAARTPRIAGIVELKGEVGPDRLGGHRGRPVDASDEQANAMGDGAGHQQRPERGATQPEQAEHACAQPRLGQRPARVDGRGLDAALDVFDVALRQNLGAHRRRAHTRCAFTVVVFAPFGPFAPFVSLVSLAQRFGELERGNHLVAQQPVGPLDGFVFGIGRQRPAQRPRGRRDRPRGREVRAKGSTHVAQRHEQPCAHHDDPEPHRPGTDQIASQPQARDDRRDPRDRNQQQQSIEEGRDRRAPPTVPAGRLQKGSNARPRGPLCVAVGHTARLFILSALTTLAQVGAVWAKPDPRSVRLPRARSLPRRYDAFVGPVPGGYNRLTRASSPNRRIPWGCPARQECRTPLAAPE